MCNEMPFIHLFNTPGGFYLYDINRNVIIKLEETIWQALKTKNYDHINDEKINQIKKMAEDGYLSGYHAEEIVHPADNVITYHLKNKIGMLTLQLTQQCNLKCNYCIYSGNYENRTHSIKKMSLLMAQKGIDYLIKHSRDTLYIALGFYGGEPLLEFELLKKCIEYAEMKTEGKDILFSITTNGTLLDDEKVSYMESHNVSLLVSLDGPKEIHDKNRVFAVNNCGTFDVVIRNIERIREKFPDFYKKISFNAVLDQSNNFSCINDFFTDFDAVRENNIMSSVVSEIYVKSKKEASEIFHLQQEYEKFKLFLSKLAKLKPEYTSKLISNYYTNLLKSYKILKPTKKLTPKIHHGGPCIPGAQRLFLNVEGEFFPCERVSEKSEVMKIGHIDTGIDIEKAKRLLNVGKLSEDSCKKCWAFRFCTLCAATADSMNDLSSVLKLNKCSNVRYSAEQSLKDICTLREMGVYLDSNSATIDFKEAL